MKKRTKILLVKLERLSLATIKELLLISIGSILIAIAYNSLLIPYHLLAGNIGGFALLIHHIYKYPIYLSILYLNIPFLVIGLFKLERKFMLHSIVGTTVMVIALHLSSSFLHSPQLDLASAAVSAGVLNGLGIGIILKAGASSSGTDILSVLMHNKYDISVGTFNFFFNMLIILASLFFLNVNLTIYTFIGIYISGKVIDSVLKGLNQKKSIMVVSKKNNEIAKRILKEIKRGVTFLDGEGAYTGEDRLIINTVVNNFENAKVREIILKTDPKAFMYITEAIEVSGKRFKR